MKLRKRRYLYCLFNGKMETKRHESLLYKNIVCRYICKVYFMVSAYSIHK